MTKLNEREYAAVVQTFLVNKHGLWEAAAQKVVDLMATDVDMSRKYDYSPERAATRALEAVLTDYPQLIQ